MTSCESPAGEPDRECDDSFERLMADGRVVKPSELRAALSKSFASGGRARADGKMFVNHRIYGESHAKLAFADTAMLYSEKPVCEVRKHPDNRDSFGGLMVGAGLYATRDVKAGGVLTEFDIHAIESAVPCRIEMENNAALFMDPRLRVNQDQLADIGAEAVAAEALSLHVGGHTTVYHFALSMRTCPHKLMHFVNDTAFCPEDGPDEAYCTSGDDGNAAVVEVYGFAIHLAAKRDIKEGEEITYHWGSPHWAELRRHWRSEGMLRATPSATEQGVAEPT